jgi:hypothetical protein
MVVKQTHNDGTEAEVTFSTGSAAGYESTPANGAILTKATNDGNPITVTHTASAVSATTEQLAVGYTDEIYFTFDHSTRTITYYHSSGPKDVIIPPTIGGTPVEHIGDNSFQGRELTSVILAESLITIGNAAFDYNQLSNLSISNSVTTIGSNAFSACKLTSIVIPDSVTSLGSVAFGSNTELSNVTIGTGLTTIPSSAFQNTSIPSIIIPPNVTSIEGYAFQASALVEITIDANVTIGLNAFQDNPPIESFTTRYSAESKAAGTYVGTPGGSWVKQP